MEFHIFVVVSKSKPTNISVMIPRLLKMGKVPVILYSKYCDFLLLCILGVKFSHTSLLIAVSTKSSSGFFYFYLFFLIK